MVRSRIGSGLKRKLGAGRRSANIVDPDWWKPMTDEEAEAFLNGQENKRWEKRSTPCNIVFRCRSRIL